MHADVRHSCDQLLCDRVQQQCIEVLRHSRAETSQSQQLRIENKMMATELV